MEFKRFLVNKLMLFFMLSTLITIAVSLIGSVFDGGARFGYDVLLEPVQYAALCMLPTFVTWSKYELSTRHLLIRKALMLLLIEAEVLFLAFRSPVIDTDNRVVVLTLAGTVLVIFALAQLFNWIKDSAEARRLNADLLQFQQIHEE